MSSIGFYEFHKDYGFWGKKNYHKKVVFPQSGKELISVTHSSLGIRNIEIEKKTSKKRILCLGGSHTWGAAVQEDDRYTNLLNKNTNLEFINFGHCSMGLDQISIFIKKESITHKPDLITIEHYPWSIHRILNNFVNGYIRPHYDFNSNGKIVLKKIQPLHNIDIYRKLIGNYLQFKKDFNEYSNDIDLDFSNGQIDPIYKQWTQFFYEDMYIIADYILREIKNFCDRHDIKLIFILNAVKEEVFQKSNSKLIDFSLPRNKFIKLINSNKIRYLDVSQTMIDQNQMKNVMFRDGHINKFGNTIIANEISNII